MAKKHRVKCKVCEQYFDTNDPTQTWFLNTSERRYYHKSCLEKYYEQRKELRDINSEIKGTNEMYLEESYYYLKGEVRIPIKYQKMESQWNHFLGKGYTAKGMYFALRFFYEVENGDTEKADGGIGIIPFVYERSKEYWHEHINRLKEICESLQKQYELFEKQEVVKIYVKDEPRKGKMIDLGSIADMEDEDD